MSKINQHTSKFQRFFCSRGGGCSFEQKIRRATNSSSNKYGDKWSAVIIYNDNGRNNLVPMAGGDDNLIPSTFMG